MENGKSCLCPPNGRFPWLGFLNPSLNKINLPCGAFIVQLHYCLLTSGSVLCTPVTIQCISALKASKNPQRNGYSYSFWTDWFARVHCCCYCRCGLIWIALNGTVNNWWSNICLSSILAQMIWTYLLSSAGCSQTATEAELQSSVQLLRSTNWSSSFQVDIISTSRVHIFWWIQVLWYPFQLQEYQMVRVGGQIWYSREIGLCTLFTEATHSAEGVCLCEWCAETSFPAGINQGQQATLIMPPMHCCYFPWLN